MPEVLPQLDLTFDPLGWAVIVGLIWPTIQAALDRPSWTRTRRLALVIAAGVVLSLILWFAGAYPLTAKLIWSQASVIIATATVAFALLKKLGVIDWIGRVTPGGETSQPKHAASTVNVPTVPEATVLPSSPGSGDASPRAPADGAGVTVIPNTEGSSLEDEDPTA